MTHHDDSYMPVMLRLCRRVSSFSRAWVQDGVSNAIAHFGFEVLHKSSKSEARVCRVTTPHGSYLTPGFVAVGTNAALKAVEFDIADSEGLDLVFCNTYHLMLHPGAEVIEQAGGLHAFTGRNRPFITDSGGFQVFSLAYGTVHEELTSIKRETLSSSTRQGNKVVKISEEGVLFKSYRDGTLMLLTPETSIQAQKKIGADIILPLDELPPYHINSRKDLQESTYRSHRWEERSLEEHLKNTNQQAIWGIIHGVSDLDLRTESVEFVTSKPFNGYAIGGALGATREELFGIVQHVMKGLSRDLPCHVLGIADPRNVPSLVTLGCDTFDSCYATRVARHGAMLWQDANGNQIHLRLGSGKYKNAHHSLSGCQCYTCQRKGYSLSYLHHLFKAREPLFQTLVSVHNIGYMTQMMTDIRTKILSNEI